MSWVLNSCSGVDGDHKPLIGSELQLVVFLQNQSQSESLQNYFLFAFLSCSIMQESGEPLQMELHVNKCLINFISLYKS